MTMLEIREKTVYSHDFTTGSRASFDAVWEMLHQLPNETYIAGSFVLSMLSAKPFVPSDVDIFTLNPDEARVLGIAMSLSGGALEVYVADLRAYITERTQEARDLMYLRQEVSEEVPRDRMQYITTLPADAAPGDLPVQVIGTRYESVQALLGDFDIACCAMALGRSEPESALTLYYSPVGLLDAQSMVARKVRMDVNTPKRLLKYSERGFRVVE